MSHVFSKSRCTAGSAWKLGIAFLQFGSSSMHVAIFCSRRLTRISVAKYGMHTLSPYRMVSPLGFPTPSGLSHARSARSRLQSKSSPYKAATITPRPTTKLAPIHAFAVSAPLTALDVELDPEPVVADAAPAVLPVAIPLPDMEATEVTVARPEPVPL